MTDKEKILAEIERQINLNNNIDPITTSQELVVDSVNVVLTDLLDYIDSLPEEPVSEVWHDSNNEQPKDLRTVVILNPEEKSGEVLQRCLCVYENRIWAYLEDILPT